MKKLRIIQRPYLLRSREAHDACCPADASDGNSETVKQEALLLKEIDETNTWARLGAQLYFGSFTLLLTVNGLATGWLFTHNGRMPPFAFLPFFLFIGLNLMGTIMTRRIRKKMMESDDRITAVIHSLTPHLGTELSSSRPLSPMPRGAIEIAFFFTGATAFLLLIFWTVLVVWGLIAGFSSLVVSSP